jgi:hypothetical protein
MRKSLSTALVASLVSLARAASAQELSPFPATTDCSFAAGDPCIERFHASVRARAYEESNASYTRGMRAFAGVSLAVGAPQLIGGIFAATQAPRDTNNVGHAVAWTLNGSLITLTGLAFAVIPFDRPTRPPSGGVSWIPTALFSLAAVGHGALAAATWIAPPQDVSPLANHLFASAMAVNALWYGSVVLLTRLDLRDPRRYARFGATPYASADGRSAIAGVAGRF